MEFKAKDIAAYRHGEVVADSNVTVSGISKIEEGKPETLTLLANPKYENYIYSTLASIVLVNKSFVPRSDIKTTLIKVENAYKAFASLLDLYVQAKKDSRLGIESPVHIHDTTTLGEDLYIGAFASIGRNTKIGDQTKIFPQVFIGENVTIGSNCIIYAGVRIYD